MRKSRIKSCSASKVTGLFPSKLVTTSTTRKKKKREEKQQAEHAWVDLKVITGFCVVSQYESFLAVRDKKRRRSGWTTSCIFHSVFFFFLRREDWVFLSFSPPPPSPFSFILNNLPGQFLFCASLTFFHPRIHRVHTKQHKKKKRCFLPLLEKRKKGYLSCLRLSSSPKKKVSSVYMHAST